MKTKNFIFYCLAIALLCSSFGNLNAQWQTSGSNIYYNGGNVGVGTTNPTWPMHMSRSVNGELSFVIENTYGGSTRTYLLSMPEKTKLASTHDIVFSTLSGTWSEKITFKNNGNVGIGTTTPDYKLDVVGTIRSHSVLINTLKTADFVFEDDYRLRSLAEIEQFITENKHLPDIAPADEMIQNGVNMGEFQIQLLQKIEELTLYVIELEKRLSEIETK